MRVLGGLLCSISLATAAFVRIPLTPLQAAAGSMLQSVYPAHDFISDPASLMDADKNVMVPVLSPFGLSTLQERSLQFAYPSSWGRFGLSVHLFGLSLYRESTVTGAGAVRFGGKLDVGIRLSVHQLTIRNYGSQKSFALSGSLAYPITKELRWSLIGMNLNAPRIGKSKELLPQIVSTGFHFKPAEPLEGLFELEKDLAYASRQKFGVIWTPVPRLSFAAGFATQPAQISAGFSIRLSRSSVDYAIASHPHLPETHSLALRLSFR